MQECKRCHKDKELIEFRKTPITKIYPLGHRKVCIECNKKNYNENINQLIDITGLSKFDALEKLKGLDF